MKRFPGLFDFYQLGALGDVFAICGELPVNGAAEFRAFKLTIGSEGKERAALSPRRACAIEMSE
jgi:hypothetical protein